MPTQPPNCPPEPLSNCPMPRGQVVDTYFMEHRAKLLDIAAFLDRVDRAGPGPGPGPGDRDDDDVRLRAMHQAITLLLDGQGDRARRILDLLSDPTTEPIPAAPGKGAIGVDPNQTYTWQ